MSETEKTPTALFIEKIKNRIFKSEGVRIGAAVFFGLFLLLGLVPFLFNNAALKFQISQKVSQISGANFAILGDVKVSFLPTPTITMHDVLLQNYRIKSEENAPEKVYNLYARKAQIKLTVFKFAKDSAIRKIIFTKAVLQSYQDSGQLVTHDDAFTTLSGELLKNAATETKKNSSGISAKLFSVADVEGSQVNSRNTPRIVIKNSALISYDAFDKKKEVTAINAEMQVGAKKMFAAGNFISEKILSNFKINVKFNSQKKKPDSFLELNSQALQIRVKGNFTSDNLGVFASDFNGKMEVEIAEFKTFYKSYIGGESVLSEKFKLNGKPIKISADVTSKAKEIAVANLLINSSLVNGKGEIDLSFTDEMPNIDVSLALENLDLDNILSPDSVTVAAAESGEQPSIAGSLDDTVETLPQIAPPLPENSEQQKSTIIKTEEEKKAEEAAKKIDLSLVKKIKDFDLTAEIQIDNIKYLEGEIKDASLYATVSHEGEIMISPMTFRIPGDGLFRVSGVVDNSGNAPKFIGKFDVSGKSLKDIFTWLKIESQNLKFDNLKEYNIYSDIFLVPNITKLGNFYLNLNSDNSEFLGEITIDNTDKVANLKSRFSSNRFNIDDYFLTSNHNLYFSPGMLIRKLLWLNDISSNAQFDLSFDKLIYGGEEFADQSMKLSFGRGYIQIENLKLKSEITDLTADMLVDISDKSPRFMINVAAEKFHYETVQNPEKIDDKKSKKQNFFDQFFAIPSLEGFNGQIGLNFANLKLDSVELKNFKLAGRLSAGSIKNVEFSSEVYGGKFNYKGLIGIGLGKVINGNLAFNNVSLKEFLPDILGINNVSGIANISANVTASATKKEEFSQSLISEIKFSAVAPTVVGYGLDDLVKKMFAPKTNAQDLLEPEKVLLNPESSTAFKQAVGSIKINGATGGKISANISGTAINGVLTGTVNLSKNTVNSLFNVIFLTGTRAKQTPINIATNINGSFEELSQTTNLDQVKQYLGLTKPAAPKEEEVVKSSLLDQAKAASNSQESFSNQAKSQMLQPIFIR